MTDDQEERLIVALEAIADELSAIEAKLAELAECTETDSNGRAVLRIMRLSEF